MPQPRWSWLFSFDFSRKVSPLYLESRMITGFSKSPGQQGLQHESYEEKYERRCKKHESLLRRHNRTTCRLTSKCQSTEAKESAQSPRQKEFFRRRNLTIEELGRTKMMLPPSKRGALFPVNCSDNLGQIPPQNYLNYLSNIQVIFNDGDNTARPSQNS